MIRPVGFVTDATDTNTGKGIYIHHLYCTTLKALRYGSHSFSQGLHCTCLYLVSVHQMMPPVIVVVDFCLQF